MPFSVCLLPELLKKCRNFSTLETYLVIFQNSNRKKRHRTSVTFKFLRRQTTFSTGLVL